MKRFKTYIDDKKPEVEKGIEMKMNTVSETEKVSYEPHTSYGFKGGKVLARKSPSSSGGGGSGNGGD